MGKAAAIADSMPTMMPAFAVAGGGQMGGAGAGTAVATGIPSPLGPFGTAMAMSTNKEREGGGSEKDTSGDKEPTETPENTPKPTGKGIDEANLKAPAPRHKAASVKMKTVAKTDNTVIEPGVDVAGDVAAIRGGKVPRIKGEYTANGRIYGAHDGTLFPISGPGFHYLTRAQFKALGVYNEFGNTARAAEILENMGIAAADRAAGLRVHEVIQ
jgi:hypothetical protein